MGFLDEILKVDGSAQVRVIGPMVAGTGIKADKPFHVLRKMFGSLIVEKHGIFAASSTLRHASIELTNAYYVDRTIKATSGLGSVISGALISPLPEKPLPQAEARKHVL